MSIQKCTGMFIAALFKIAKKKKKRGGVGGNNPNFNQLMNKHNMVYAYSGILFGRHTTRMMYWYMLWHRWNLKTLCEVKEASLQEPYMIPFTRNMLHRQIYRDREWSGCLRLEETGRMGILARINEISLRCNGRDLNLWWGVHSPITILKVFELCTLNEWIK